MVCAKSGFFAALPSTSNSDFVGSNPCLPFGNLTTFVRVPIVLETEPLPKIFSNISIRSVYFFIVSNKFYYS